MTDRDEEEFRELLRAFLEGRGDVDPAKLASAAGLPANPALIGQLMSQLQRAMASEGDGIDWSDAGEQAAAIAGQGTVVTLPEEHDAFLRALQVAELWLDEATDIPQGAVAPRILSRREWATATIGVWTEFAAPVADSIANALTDALAEAAPEDIEGMLPNATRMVRKVGGALFAMQLGQVVGQLSAEVLSGGDIGLPLLDDGAAAVLPQNAIEFGRSLEQPLDQVELWLAARELAHARLFRHARWLRLQLLTAMREYSQGIRIDTERLQELAEDFDPADPEAIREALQSGAFIPPPTEAQLAARARLESTLALVEGWVDVVTADATRRLPSADAIAEAIRRRRAAGGPAERALGVLAGLELRPRRLREAAQMWRAATEAVGAAGRDALWSHPDLVPTDADVDDPAALVARLTAGAPEPDDVDRAIEELLGDDGPERPTEL
ncbi:MAG: zinc-dependent metalloprotease [Microbacteriaceae bacterium]|nr:zinc-dependent metalloprotease [Microbacteriaceae bacterium]